MHVSNKIVFTDKKDGGLLFLVFAELLMGLTGFNLHRAKKIVKETEVSSEKKNEDVPPAESGKEQKDESFFEKKPKTGKKK